jgi:type IV pilus assembly protein PilW
MMVAMALSLIIVASLAELFANMSRANQEMAKTNSQIENARFAMQFLQSDIVHGGFWGGYIPEFDDLSITSVPTDAPAIVPDPCLAFDTPWSAAYTNALLGISVQVYSEVPPNCAGVVTNKLANTDVLVVRHANTCLPGDANCEADIAGQLYMQVSNCDTEIDAGNTEVLDPNSFPLTQRDCVTPAPKRKFIQNIYYVRDHLITPGDGIPTLMRSEFGLAGGIPGQMQAVPLVEGIERFRVEVGIDDTSKTAEGVNYGAAILWADPSNLSTARNRGDGIPDGAFIYCDGSAAPPCTPAQLTDIVALRLYLLARADQSSPGYADTKTYALGSAGAVGPFNDDFKRHLFSTTVRLNNVAGRRDTPPLEVVAP